MAETTEEFMARFRATGLDMLCEAQRRDRQTLPWYMVSTGRVSTENPTFGWPYGLEAAQRSVWKGAAVGKTYIDPETFFDRDFTALEERVMQMHITTPSGPYRDSFRRMFQLDPARWLIQSDGDWSQRVRIDPTEWDRLVSSGRRVRSSLNRLSAAFIMAATSLSSTSTMYENKAEQYEAQDRTLWPGVKAQHEGERKYNAKRIAKERLKKKLAKKRK